MKTSLSVANIDEFDYVLGNLLRNKIQSSEINLGLSSGFFIDHDSCALTVTSAGSKTGSGLIKHPCLRLYWIHWSSKPFQTFSLNLWYHKIVFWLCNYQYSKKVIFQGGGDFFLSQNEWATDLNVNFNDVR